MTGFPTRQVARIAALYTVTLQPLSASGIVGTGVSVGIEEFELS